MASVHAAVASPAGRSAPAGVAAASRARTILLAVIAAAVFAVTIERLWLGLGGPLWLDETWTVMIAAQPDWAHFWREAWLDCNPPLYYAFMKLWVGVAGDSNLALRIPSFLFFYLAAVVPLASRAHGLPREAAAAWGALILLWYPGVAMTLDARAYGLLIFECTLLALAFMRAWRHCTVASLSVWAVLGTLAVLTHYFAGFLVAVQGVLLLARWRLALVRRAYALAPFALAAGWIAIHLPRLHDYSRPDVVWYEPTGLDQVAGYALYTVNGWNPLFGLLLALALGGAWWKSRRSDGGTPPSRTRPRLLSAAIEPAHAAAISGVLGLAVILLMSSGLASLTDRYLVPLVPFILLGVIALARRIAQANLALLLVVIVYAVIALNPASHALYLRDRAFYGYEQPSDFVAKARPTDLVFVWDHPAAKILDRGSLEQIGGFFLGREGQHVRTHALILSERDDPNAAIKASVPNATTGVIWLYDAQRRSAAGRHPPALNERNGWDCRDERSYRKRKHKWRLSVGRIACVPLAKG